MGPRGMRVAGVELASFRTITVDGQVRELRVPSGLGFGHIAGGGGGGVGAGAAGGGGAGGQSSADATGTSILYVAEKMSAGAAWLGAIQDVVATNAVNLSLRTAMEEVNLSPAHRRALFG